ncbi:MAG: DUF2339 domain-containing protein [Wohlfahrtiimonas sp.]
MGEILIFIVVAIGLWLIFIRQPNLYLKDRIAELTSILNLLQHRVNVLEKELKEKPTAQPATNNCYDRHRKELLEILPNVESIKPREQEVVIEEIIPIPIIPVIVPAPIEIIEEEPTQIVNIAETTDTAIEDLLDDQTIQDIQTQITQELKPKPVVKQVVVIPKSEPKPQQPSLLATWIKKGIHWFSEGNVPVKVGMLILLFGVGSLLKYALDQSWFTMTHALLLTTAAASGAFVFAYCKRESHRLFSLTVQGGSIGVLLLTLFTAGKIEQLISLNIAFAGSFALIAATAILSVRQNAIALAIFAIFSGFMAPIWLSSGSNNYIALFSYYTLLNLGIIAIAWFKPWQKLNLLGFIFTFGVGITWGVLKYEPQNFNTTEPFLILFFVLYLIIPIFYANRMKDHKEKIVDAFLVFGNPLIALSIQAYLLDYSRTSLTFNAWGIALTYGALAYSIRRITDYRLLKVAYTALFWFFVILAIPLAFAAKQTGIIYTLFGAMLFWWAEKVNDAYTRKVAILFHILSVFTVIYGVITSLSLLAYTSNFLALAFSAFFIIYQCIKHQRHNLEKIMLADGLFFWLLAGSLQILEINGINLFALMALFLGGTALALGYVHRFVEKSFEQLNKLYRDVALSLLVTGALTYLMSLANIVPISQITSRWHDFSFIAWYIFAAIFWLVFWLLRREREQLVQITQLFFWGCNLIVIIYDFNWFAHLINHDAASIQLSWIFIAIPLILAYCIRAYKPQWLIAPFKENYYLSHRYSLTTLVGLIAIVWLILFSSMGTTFLISTWLPVLNAYDLTQLLLLACMIHYGKITESKYSLYGIVSIAFIMTTMIIVRSIYHWFGTVGMDISQILASPEFFIAESIALSLATFSLVNWIYQSQSKQSYISALSLQVIVIFFAWLMIQQHGLLVNPLSIGGIVTIASLFTSAYITYRRDDITVFRIFYSLGIIWWFAISALILDKFFVNENFYSALLIWGILTGTATSFLYKKLAVLVRELSITSTITIGLGLCYIASIITQNHLLGEWRIIVWLIYVALSYQILHNLKRQLAIEAYLAQKLLIIANLTVIVLELNYYLGFISNDISITILSLTLPLLLLSWLTIYYWKIFIAPYEENPMIPQRKTQLSLLILSGIIILPSQILNGTMIGLWLPIVNTLELPAYLYLFLLFKSAQKFELNTQKINIGLIIAVCSLISITVIRACYFYLDLPSWSLRLLSNGTIQMALTIVWTLLGFGLWIYGSKKPHRFIWNIGAALMGLVLLKLLLVDRANLGNVTGIISFIGYGLFCLVIGYLAPQPPKEQQE